MVRCVEYSFRGGEGRFWEKGVGVELFIVGFEEFWRRVKVIGGVGYVFFKEFSI